jgi:hypothetical protein
MTMTAPSQTHDLAPPSGMSPERVREMVMHHLADLVTASQAISQPALPFHRFTEKGGLELAGHGYVLRPPSPKLGGLAVTRNIARPTSERMHFPNLFSCIAGHLTNVELHAFRVENELFVVESAPLDLANFDPAAIGKLAWQSSIVAAKSTRYTPWARGEAAAHHSPRASTPSPRSNGSWRTILEERKLRLQLAQRLADPGVGYPSYIAR